MPIKRQVEMYKQYNIKIAYIHTKVWVDTCVFVHIKADKMYGGRIQT